MHGLEPSRVPALLRAVAEREVSVYRTDVCYPQPPDRAELLLGFTRLNEQAIDEWMARLADALTSLR